MSSTSFLGDEEGKNVKFIHLPQYARAHVHAQVVPPGADLLLPRISLDLTEGGRGCGGESAWTS